MRMSLLAMLALSGCDGPPPAEWTRAGSFADTKASVDTVNTLETGRSANRLLREAPAAKIIRIAFVSEGQDRLGNKIEVPLYVLSFDGKDVRAAKFENLDPWQTMGLAQEITVRSGVGRALLLKDCDAYRTLCARL